MQGVKGSRKSRLPDEKIIEIETLYEQGKTQREIASCVGVNVATVNTHIKRLKAIVENKKEQSKLITEKNKAIAKANTVRKGVGIDLSLDSTEEQLKKDIITSMRHHLVEITTRLPTMTDKEVLESAYNLLGEINKGTTDD